VKTAQFLLCDKKRINVRQIARPRQRTLTCDFAGAVVAAAASINRAQQALMMSNLPLSISEAFELSSTSFAGSFNQVIKSAAN
jgi:hypothetical protein